MKVKKLKKPVADEFDQANDGGLEKELDEAFKKVWIEEDNKEQDAEESIADEQSLDESVDQVVEEKAPFVPYVIDRLNVETIENNDTCYNVVTASKPIKLNKKYIGILSKHLNGEGKKEEEIVDK